MTDLFAEETEVRIWQPPQQYDGEAEPLSDAYRELHRRRIAHAGVLFSGPEDCTESLHHASDE